MTASLGQKKIASVFGECLEGGKNSAVELEHDARALMEKMRAIHGGRWSVDINHKTRFIAICYDGEERPARRCP